MSLASKLENIILEIIGEEELEDLEETSVSSGAGDYGTPMAFSGKKKSDKNKEKKNATTSTGYKIVGESKLKHSEIMKEIYGLNYPCFKKDESKNSKQKVNGAIREISKRLFQIERIINRTAKLKREAGVSSDNYWKSTKPRMGKIAERLLKVSQKLREISS